MDVGDVIGGGAEVELLGERRRPVRNEKREGLEAVAPAVAGRGFSSEDRDGSVSSLPVGGSGLLRCCAILRSRIWSS